VLSEHFARYQANAAALDLRPSAEACVFSIAPDNATPLRPDAVDGQTAAAITRLYDTRIRRLVYDRW
jgi:hypothetical protein